MPDLSNLPTDFGQTREILAKSFINKNLDR